MVLEGNVSVGIAGLKAPTEDAVALSHVEGISDSARARELYKYYQPSVAINADTCFPPPHVSDDVRSHPDVNVRSDITTTKISSPDTALTAFCHLIDDATQYFIAESTMTVDLVDNTKHAPGDEIWMGCSTIKVAPTKAGGTYPSFIVGDLTKDERFNLLPFVTGPPLLKFYAGVPLITRRGIPIGSLFIVDDRVRLSLSDDEINFMGTMAGTIMKHIDMVRQVEEHRRGMKMNRGLASLVEGRGELVDAEADMEDSDTTKMTGQLKTDAGVGRTNSKGLTPVPVGSVFRSAEHEAKEHSAAEAETDEGMLTSHVELGAQPMRPSLASVSQPASFHEINVGISSPQEHQNKPIFGPEGAISEASPREILFSRAVNLIREAFEVDGGAVFYDARRGFSSDMHRKPEPGVRCDGSQADSHSSSDDLPSARECPSEQGDAQGLDPNHTIPPPANSSGLLEGTFSRTLTESKTAEILGFSTASASSIHGDRLPGAESFSALDEKALHTLLRRYPRGKIWSFDSDGAMSSSSEEESLRPDVESLIQRSRNTQGRKCKSARNKSDANFLSRHFPGARQLLFVPLWDAGRSRWFSGCFAWSTDPTRVLSEQSELAFLSAFGNSVMAECSRIDTEIADQKKGDFIGSISHELRSPLHGILASAEFLRDEVTTGFEKGLVGTIESCGRTLLDTINHVLDFSKISHFEKIWRKNKRGRNRPAPWTRRGSLALQHSDLPLINLVADVDISVLCEEVVEGVFAGHAFQDVAAQGFDTVPDAQGELLNRRNSDNQIMDAERLQRSEVVVIFDVDVQNYRFVTQPGAVRRVIMNLLGNALKYTSRGYVCIKLDAADIDDPPPRGNSETISRTMVVLTVTDTGKGISSEFLRSKVFTPFAQENSLSSGTGLGLSIVRNIVAVLEGDITIDSELGRGTQVRVTLPLLREMPTPLALSTSTPRSGPSIPREDDRAISKLRAEVIGQKVLLCGFNLDSKDPIIYKMGQLLKASITNLVTEWYGLEVVSLHQNASIIIANEADPATISKLTCPIGNDRNPPSIVVLCSHSSRFDRSLSPTEAKCNVGFVAKPVGPLKLAKALLQCLQRGPSTTATAARESALQEESKTLGNVFEVLSLSPQGGEILDNSRLATGTENTRTAVQSFTPNASIENDTEFPFPASVDEMPSLPKTHSAPPDKPSLKPLTGGDSPASSVLAGMENSATKLGQNVVCKPLHPARLLIVDDNRINLTLLRTYLRKRKYELVDEAENGLEAVEKFQEREDGYDIIFMDISMPVLNGFDATRQIRAIEGSRQKKLITTILKRKSDRGEDGLNDKGLEKLETPALVIALTGLTSSRDQSEAFASGIDLFLTKPVAFKEVGKLLDNWEVNRERDASGFGI
ncbi:hypothetical protein V498_10734 [Pseudogymnoascus sp. VKM F-4517 (FW-2822)]|nr:hypothetical protein V498_10734 [Pseudogymnoascus sp. VKM F-4517 (FW-2822)]